MDNNKKMKLWSVTISVEVPVLAETEGDAELFAEEALTNCDISSSDFSSAAVMLLHRRFENAIPFGPLEDNPEDLTVKELRETLLKQEWK